MLLGAREIARLLAGNVVRLVLELLPNGRREGAEWVHPSFTGTSQRSLSVRLTGPKAGVYSDFSSGEALDLVAALLFGGDKRRAIAWARHWLAVEETRAAQLDCARPLGQRHSDDGDKQARQSAALRIFNSATTRIARTPVDLYLRGRGINLAELGGYPPSLRYHPALRNRESGIELPAMVAAVVDHTGKLTAVHRTWLQQIEANRWIKARLDHPKMTLGSVAGNAIRIWPGPKTTPDAPTSGTSLVIAEGIEDALSCAILCPEFAVWSAVSLSNLAHVVLPPAAKTVVIAADNDGENRAAAQALQRAIGRFASESRIVRLARSPYGKDFADLLVDAE